MTALRLTALVPLGMIAAGLVYISGTGSIFPVRSRNRHPASRAHRPDESFGRGKDLTRLHGLVAWIFLGSETELAPRLDHGNRQKRRARIDRMSEISPRGLGELGHHLRIETFRSLRLKRRQPLPFRAIFPPVHEAQDRKCDNA